MIKSKVKLFDVRITNKFVAYILAKLKLTYDELVDSLAFDPLAQQITAEQRQIRLRTLLYFTACHGYDLEELEWEAERRVILKDVEKALALSPQAAERLIRASGVPLLTERPLSILQSDLMLIVANPKQAPKLSRMLRTHPLTLWRRAQGISHREFVRLIGAGSQYAPEWEAGMSLPAKPKLIEKIGKACGQTMFFEMLEWKRIWDLTSRSNSEDKQAS